MSNQFKNIHFNGSTKLKELVVDQLITEIGKHQITLSNSDYSEVGGYRPYQLTVDHHENGEFSIIRILECSLNHSNELVMSNLFDFEEAEYIFEFVGKIKEKHISKEELEEIFNLFTGNLASYFDAGCYDEVEVKKII